MKRNGIKLLIAIFSILFICNSAIAVRYTRGNIKNLILAAMKAYHVPVVGYAIINNNRVVEARTLSIDPKIKVSRNSLFQAASISKSLSAYAALRLVGVKKLSLDEPINDYLTSWKIPKNQYNKNSPVSLRDILSMTSGLSVSGFAGYPQGVSMPTLKEILDGTPPANNKPIRVFYSPGSRYFYSGGGFQVLQQFIDDVYEKPFVEYMNGTFLKKLRMHNSIFQFPLTGRWKKRAVPGFLADGKIVPDGWNNYAIAAAGGMWTTPSDLARYAIHVSKAYLGNIYGLTTHKLMREMLKRQSNSDYGLGVVVNGERNSLNFRKSGHTLGYQSRMMMFPDAGKGLVVMTNSDNGIHVIDYITPIVAYTYHWPCYFSYFDEAMPIPKFSC